MRAALLQLPGNVAAGLLTNTTVIRTGNRDRPVINRKNKLLSLLK